MKTDEVTRRIRAYMKDNFLYARPDFVLEDNTHLLESGIIDSMGVMELLEFIEEAFGLTVGDQDVTEDNLGTVDAISRYVVVHLAPQAR